ncbi:MAG TPA: substrate-binding and VWA domain-containing protein [Actinomycetes bacterium]|nr:substrate-binding and VWA domain-containing protein [Actinomycetes bacterium]
MVVQPQRRSRRPFLIAAVVAVLLIAGVRFLLSDGGGAPAAGGGARACDGDTTAITMVASSEKAELVKQLAADYGRTGPEVDGRCVSIQVSTKASGEAMSALARDWNVAADGPRPDVWSPASSGWATLLRQRRQAADKPDLVPADAPKVAASPLVIAMPKPMAQVLGWPAKQLGWSDLLRLAREPRGWARFGHPEWGRFKLGKTNPNYSTSGLNATIGTYFAATGRSTDLTAKDVANPKVRGFVGAVEGSVVHYGDTTLTFLSNLQRADDQGAGLSYISAVTVEEKSVWDYNQGNPTGNPAMLGRHARPKVPLVAIYPKEGTLLSDHPYLVLTAPWVDDAKRAAAADFLKYLQSGPAQDRFERFAFRNHTGKAGRLITQANGLLPGQPSTLLSPPPPAVLDRLLASWAGLRKRANVLLVTDVSGSMGAPAEGTDSTKLALAQRAAVNALGQFADGDRVGLWMFSTDLGSADYQELVPIGPLAEHVGGGRRRDVLRERIQGLTPQGGTGLYDTALAAYRFVSGRVDPRSINAVVLLTDGKNEDSNGISLDSLLQQLDAEQGAESVRVFTVAYGADADLPTLRRIAEGTDAAAYDSLDPARIDKVFAAVISNF